MNIELTFTEMLRYDEQPTGISIPVALQFAGQAITTEAKVDPGAEVCLFRHELGLRLGIPVEQGIPIHLDTLAGSLAAFGHEVTLQTGEMVFQSVVYFAKYPGLPRNLLGRRGWLRNLKLAIVDYDNLLYLGAYEA
jgi:hypothetical protein